MPIFDFQEMVAVLSATISSYETSNLIAILAITAVAWLLLFIFLLSGETGKPRWKAGTAGRHSLLIWSNFWIAGAIAVLVCWWGFFAWRLSNGQILVPTAPTEPIGVVFGYGLIAAAIPFAVGWLPKAVLPKGEDAPTPQEPPQQPADEENSAQQPLYPGMSFDVSHQPVQRTAMEQAVQAAPGQHKEAATEEDEVRPRRGRLVFAVGAAVLAVAIFGAATVLMPPETSDVRQRFEIADLTARFAALFDGNGDIIRDEALDFQTNTNGASVRVGDFATDADRWRPLAEQGNAAAQFKLGVLYANGRGVPRDFIEAYMWLNIAAALGNEKAAAGRDAVARRMTPAEVEMGQTRAREQHTFGNGGILSGEALARLQKLNNTELVRQAQRLLNSRGYSVGAADGVAGERTKAAVRDFERQGGLAVTGTITPKLVAHLEGRNETQQRPASSNQATFVTPPRQASKQTTSRPAPTTECDRLAAHPSNSLKSAGVAGVVFARIDAVRAIPACEQAAAKYPDEKRFNFQLARSLHKAERFTEALATYRKAGEQGSSLAQRSVGFMYANGSGVARNLSKAASWLHRAAERCDADAQFALGMLYADGQGVEKSEAEATRWFQIAAAQDHADALNRLNGFALQSLRVRSKFQPDDYTAEQHLEHLLAKQDNGVAKAFERKDYSTAVKTLRPLAEGGDASAQTLLGYMYRSGFGVEYDNAKAVEWFRKAADQEDPNAQFQLGYMYQHGFGVSQYFAQALQWYRKSALQGVAAARVNLGGMYDNAQGVSPDREESLAQYRSAAEAGLAAAQHRLGEAYEDGRGVSRDLGEAVKWYRLAAAQKFALSQNKLGEMHDRGRGVPRDAAEAVKWYRLAAEQGLPDAIYNLAVSFAGGRGVNRDPVEALRLYTQAAEQGHDRSQFAVGLAHLQGRGVDRSYDDAATWFHKAAAQCNADAQYQLANMYKRGQGVPEASAAEELKWLRLAAERGQADALNALSIRYADGKGVKKDPARALEAMQRAAAGGNASAQFNLAEVYTQGRDDVAQDLEKAADLYRQAAQQGNRKAQYKLAEFYREGLGVPRSYVEAVNWYSRAADGGDLLAQHRLATAYRLGAGIERDLAQAVNWYRQAAEQGEPNSQRDLGLHYLRGEGVLQDYVQAHLWLKLAVSNGDAEAGTALNRLSSKMTPNQVAESGRLEEARGADGG